MFEKLGIYINAELQSSTSDYELLEKLNLTAANKVDAEQLFDISHIAVAVQKHGRSRRSTRRSCQLGQHEMWAGCTVACPSLCALQTIR